MFSTIRSICSLVLGVKQQPQLHEHDGKSNATETRHRRAKTAFQSSPLDPVKIDPQTSSKQGGIHLPDIKYINPEHRVQTRLKSVSVPVFPKPSSTGSGPTANTSQPNLHEPEDPTVYVSPLDRETQRLREEMNAFKSDIYVLEHKKAPVRNQSHSRKRLSRDSFPDFEIMSGSSSCGSSIHGGPASSLSSSITLASPEFARDALKYRCSTLFGERARFTPSSILFNSHMQTTFVQLCKAMPPFVVFEREMISLSDGATTSLDWFPKIPSPASHMHDPTPIIFLVHGMNGSSAEPYIRSLTTLATQSRNYRVVALNYRGCGGTMLTTPRVFDGLGGAGDIKDALDHIRKVRAGRAKIVGVGWSLGANMILNYLCETKSMSQLAGAMALSAVFDLSQTLDLCCLTTHGAYGAAFSFGLQYYLMQNWAMLKDHYNFTDCLDLRDFAIRFTGASDRALREVHQTLKRRVGGICVPTLCLSSRDDPVTKPHWAPLGEMQRNPHLVFATTAQGGHVGWFEGGGVGGVSPTCWANRVILEWIDFVLQP